MIQFSKAVDLRSRKSMTDYLRSHFRYNTMNSWNRSQSYACNLKIDRLGLTCEMIDKLYDMMETQEFFDIQEKMLDEFSADHEYRWQAHMNGRSGGYLVLYQGELIPSKYQSFCTVCGQRNYTSVRDTGNICGRCQKPARKDYTSPPMQIVTYPGKGLDEEDDYETWELYELRDRVRLVQEFDRLADRMVKTAVNLAQNWTVEEEEILVPQTQKILVPITG